MKGGIVLEQINNGRTPAVQAVLGCNDPDEARAAARLVKKGEVTVEDVLECRHNDAACILANLLPFGAATADDVVRCRHPDAAHALAYCARDPIMGSHVAACQHDDAALFMAKRVTIGNATAADVIACSNAERYFIARMLLYSVVDGSVTVADVLKCDDWLIANGLAHKVGGTVTIEDVIWCKHKLPALTLFFKIRDKKVIADCDCYRLYVAGAGASKRYATAGYGLWTAEQALEYWGAREDRMAKVFTAAIVKDQNG